MDLPLELQVAIKSFTDNATAICDELFNTQQSQPLPEKIYHYTNDVGLRGILESGKIWRTSFVNLNDHSEIKYGVSLAADILNELSADGTRIEKIFAKTFETSVLGEIASIGHFFISSFSTDKDELGQWRAYADDGNGYALEFDTKILKNILDIKKISTDGLFASVRIDYRKDTIKNYQRQLVEKAFALVSCASKLKVLNIEQDYLVALSAQLASHVIYTSLHFKHNGYRSEQEYRFLQVISFIAPFAMSHYFRKDEVVKYTKMNWVDGETSALTGIFIGPAADNEKSKKYVEDCLEVSLRQSVPIGFSGIPYRSSRKS